MSCFFILLEKAVLKNYRDFISHAWAYDDPYDRIEGMLDEAFQLEIIAYLNMSVMATIYTQHRIDGSFKVHLEGLTNLNHTDCKSGRDKEPVRLSRPTPLLQINSKPLIAKVLRIKP